MIGDPYSWGVVGTVEPSDGQVSTIYVCHAAGHRIPFSPLTGPPQACPECGKQRGNSLEDKKDDPAEGNLARQVREALVQARGLSRMSEPVFHLTFTLCSEVQASFVATEEQVAFLRAALTTHQPLILISPTHLLRIGADATVYCSIQPWFTYHSTGIPALEAIKLLPTPDQRSS